MVNGQTGKLVGGLPYVMWKVVVTMIVLFGVFTTFIPFIVSGILGALSDSDDAPGKLIGVIIVGAIFIIIAGINYFTCKCNSVFHAVSLSADIQSSSRIHQNCISFKALFTF